MLKLNLSEKRKFWYHIRKEYERSVSDNLIKYDFGRIIPILLFYALLGVLLLFSISKILNKQNIIEENFYLLGIILIIGILFYALRISRIIIQFIRPYLVLYREDLPLLEQNFYSSLEMVVKSNKISKLMLGIIITMICIMFLVAGPSIIKNDVVIIFFLMILIPAIYFHIKYWLQKIQFIFDKPYELSKERYFQYKRVLLHDSITIVLIFYTLLVSTIFGKYILELLSKLITGQNENFVLLNSKFYELVYLFYGILASVITLYISIVIILPIKIFIGIKPTHIYILALLLLTIVLALPLSIYILIITYLTYIVFLGLRVSPQTNKVVQFRGYIITFISGLVSITLASLSNCISIESFSILGISISFFTSIFIDNILSQQKIDV